MKMSMVFVALSLLTAASTSLANAFVTGEYQYVNCTTKCSVDPRASAENQKAACWFRVAPKFTTLVQKDSVILMGTSGDARTIKGFLKQLSTYKLGKHQTPYSTAGQYYILSENSLVTIDKSDDSIMKTTFSIQNDGSLLHHYSQDVVGHIGVPGGKSHLEFTCNFKRIK